MMRILIITGGRIDEDFALSFMREMKFDHTIVVDGALAFWDKVGEKCKDYCKFDHLVGDFDTISPDILEKYLHRGDITVHQFNPVKDNTDTDIAVELAIDLAGNAPAQFFILGGTGTRMDHTLANIQLLQYIRSAGKEGILVDEHNRIRLVSGSVNLRRKDLFGKYLSLVPLTQTLKGVTLRGFKYEAQDLDVVLGQTRCVSNEVYDDVCTIDIREGIAWMIESRD